MACVSQAPHLPRKLSIKVEEDRLGYLWQLMEVIVVPLGILFFVIARYPIGSTNWKLPLVLLM